MKVSLITSTPDAWNLLLGTKSTRMRGADPATMTDDERQAHWEYMLDTIESPFEFVDYIFQIEGVSKNFTHQLVRTRTGAYQQETSRALDMSENGTVVPDNFEDGSELQRLFMDAVADANAHYQQLIAAGAQLQDARAVLPSNMETKIMCKFNLRTLSEMAKKRLCARTQGEYQQAFRRIRELVLDIHPWAESLLQPQCAATGTCAFPRWGGKVTGSMLKVIELSPSGMSMSIIDEVTREVFEEKYNGFGFMIGRDSYQCPHYDPRMDLTQLKKEVRLKFWSAKEITQANPVAKNGVSM